MDLTLGNITEHNKTEPHITDRRNFGLVGKGRTGKSQTLVRMALDDIHNDQKIVFIGPQDSSDEVLRFIPNQRQEDTIYFNPTLQPMGANPFFNIPTDKHGAVADAFADAILSRSSFSAGETPRIENLITGAVLTLLKKQNESPLSLYYLLTKKGFRHSLQTNLGQKLMHFWNIFESLSPRDQYIEVSSTINKLSKLVYDSTLERCFDQEGNYIDLDNGITIVSLDKHKLGDTSHFLAGALVIANLIGQIGADTNVTVYIDEADAFGSRILSTLLRQSRINTIFSTSSIHNFQNTNEILKNCEIFALEMSVKDAQLLTPQFTFDETHYPLNMIPALQGYVMDYYNYARKIELTQHSYHEAPKRKKKSVSERIIARCKDQCSQYPSTIGTRLMRFFE